MSRRERKLPGYLLVYQDDDVSEYLSPTPSRLSGENLARLEEVEAVWAPRMRELAMLVREQHARFVAQDEASEAPRTPVSNQRTAT